MFGQVDCSIDNLAEYFFRLAKCSSGLVESRLENPAENVPLKVNSFGCSAIIFREFLW